MVWLSHQKKPMHGSQDSGTGTFYLKCHLEKWKQTQINIFLGKQKKFSASLRVIILGGFEIWLRGEAEVQLARAHMGMILFVLSFS